MPLTPTNLLCELRENPVGVGVPNPRLSWELQGSGSRQVSCRIQASLAPSFSGSLLWDSGEINSSQTHSHLYSGPQPGEASRVWWRVSVKDESGTEAWSSPSSWVTGLAEWPGSWITTGRQAVGPEPPSLEGASWICHPKDKEAKEGYRRWIRLRFNCPPDAQSALLAMSADNQFQASLNGEPVLSSGEWRRAQSGSILGPLKEGSNELVILFTNYDGFGALIGALAIQTPLQSVLIETGAGWEARADESDDWVPVHVHAPYGAQPWGPIPNDPSVVALPAAHFRREFQLKEAPAFAALFVSALGVASPRVNGTYPTEAVLIPGWTDYHKRVRSEAIDVTSLLRPGSNCLAAALGDGWHGGYLAFTGRRRVYEQDSHLRMALVVQFGDGSRQVVATDGDWEWSEGAIRENDLLMGTTVDFREERQGWDSPGFRGAGWRQAVAASLPVPIQSHPAGAPRRQRRDAGKIIESGPRRVLVDFGRNIVGWVRFSAKGAPGQTLTVRHAEMLEGSKLYLTNLRAAKATDAYILSDSESTSCEPDFTFHGFRYAEITSDQDFVIEGLPEAIVIHTDMPLGYEFSSGNELLDGLIRNSRTSLEGNGLDLFTDCPQRDERAGWTGDAQVYARTGYYLGKIGPLAEKHMVDLLSDTQKEDGTLGDVAPHVSVVGFGNAGWEDAGIIIPWQHWWMTGETGPILQHWDSMVRFNESLSSRADSHGLRPAGSYGDWLNLAGLQHSQLLATLYASLCALRLGEMADEIGKDSSAFFAQAQERRDIVLRSFQQEDGRLIEKDVESQSFYSLFLNHPLTTRKDEIEAAGRHLVRLLKAREMKIATGFLGTSHLLPALEKAGFAEEAFDVLLNEDFPGWLYQVKVGATSMWERWDSWRPETGFQDPGMNSFNHFWIGCVAEWMMEGPGGIRPSAPGFAKVVFAPQFTRRLPHVKAATLSPRGRVACSWAWEGDQIRVSAETPPNMSWSLSLAPGEIVSGDETNGGKPGLKSWMVKPARSCR